MQDQDDLCPPFITRSSGLQVAHIKRMTDAIREVEWGGPFASAATGICPICGSSRLHGHRDGCAIGLALMPDGGVGALQETIAEGMRRIANRRLALQSMVGAADRELNDLAACLEWVQDMLHRLEHHS